MRVPWQFPNNFNNERVSIKGSRGIMEPMLWLSLERLEDKRRWQEMTAARWTLAYPPYPPTHTPHPLILPCFTSSTSFFLLQRSCSFRASFSCFCCCTDSRQPAFSCPEIAPFKIATFKIACPGSCERFRSNSSWISDGFYFTSRFLCFYFTSRFPPPPPSPLFFLFHLHLIFLRRRRATHLAAAYTCNV